MSFVISWIFALFSGRFIFRRLYKKENGQSVVRYYTAGAFCIAYIFTFALYVFPALLFDSRVGGGPNKGFESNLMSSLAIFVGMALVFTVFGFGFGKLKEKFGDDSRSN